MPVGFSGKQAKVSAGLSLEWMGSGYSSWLVPAGGDFILIRVSLLRKGTGIALRFESHFSLTPCLTNCTHTPYWFILFFSSSLQCHTLLMQFLHTSGLVSGVYYVPLIHFSLSKLTPHSFPYHFSKSWYLAHSLTLFSRVSCSENR